MGDKTRRVDGKPETKADRKFFNLRESGFKGPIDHKGDPVMTEVDRRGNPRPMFGKKK